MQRTFIAFKILPGQKMSACIGTVREALGRERITWVDPGKLHITLRFLGDTGLPQVSEVEGILERIVPGFACPELVFRGMGLFRDIRDPRVLWIGMDPGPILPKLKEALDRELAGIGFPPEDRKFRPHLTLARIKYIRNTDPLEEVLEKYSDAVFQKSRISEILYYESILKPEGPEYLPLKIVALKTPGS